ncbi:SGNH/GDSL hydrolase family protein [Elusimicrobiota bacterium]
MRKIILIITGISAALLVSELTSYIIIQRLGITGLYRKGCAESFEPGNFFFRPHHYFALEANPNFTSKFLKINRYGLTGKDFDPVKKDNEYRIAFLGGSTTQSIPQQYLEDQLQNLSSNKDITVINCGIGTYTSAETLIAYLFKISYLDPDLIIIYHASNDIFPEAYYKNKYPDYRQHRKIWKNAIKLPDIFYFFLHRSSLLKLLHYIWIQHNFNIWDFSLNKLELSHKEALKNINADSFGLHFETNIRRLITIALNEKTDVILITFICSSEKAPPSWYEGIRKLNNITRKLAYKYKTYLLDLEKTYRTDPPEIELFHADDSVHFTPEGDTWRMNKFIEFIKNNNIIK